LKAEGNREMLAKKKKEPTITVAHHQMGFFFGSQNSISDSHTPIYHFKPIEFSSSTWTCKIREQRELADTHHFSSTGFSFISKITFVTLGNRQQTQDHHKFKPR